MSNWVLIVDDDRMIRALITGLLRKTYDVATASCGEEALAIAAKQMPALVLLDIMMPGIDGFETCRRLKAMTSGDSPQIIIVSTASSEEEQARAFAVGADAYLVKPFDPQVLRSAVRSQFHLRDAIRRATSLEAAVQLRHDRVIEEHNRQIFDTQDIAVFAMAKLAESRDEETGEHLIRVRSYSQILAAQLRESGSYGDEITEQFLSDLHRSSPLHDIGKVAISDAILLKPGPLTPDEYDVVKMHTLLGARFLEEVVFHSQSGGFLAMAVAIARFHHEWFDGTGYPTGLRGTDIPLSARIVALADVFDALTSARPYKLAYTSVGARQIICAEGGRHFDPAIVAAFEARFDDFATIQGDAGVATPRSVQTAALDQKIVTPSTFLVREMEKCVNDY